MILTCPMCGGNWEDFVLDACEMPLWEGAIKGRPAPRMCRGCRTGRAPWRRAA